MTKKLTIIILLLIYLPALMATDLENMAPDLIAPSTTDHAPAPGKRVRQSHKNYLGRKVYHTLYLPTDWVKGKSYPVIVEYAGNKWKSSPGTVEGSHLGYGISGGKGVIWICMPFVDKLNKRNATTWWGNVDATVKYCKTTVRQICADYGGDSSKVFIAGFSRGSIAFNYIGLHDNEISSLWRGFICHSHYDGVKAWPYKGSDRTSAKLRLQRLGNRPQFISQEKNIDTTKNYLKNVLPAGKFTFQLMSFSNHTDTWVLRDLPERKVLRDWFWKTLE